MQTLAKDMHRCLFSEPMNSDRNIAMKMDALAIVKLIRIVIWCLTMAIDCTSLLVLVNIFLKYARSKKNGYYRFHMSIDILRSE